MTDDLDALLSDVDGSDTFKSREEEDDRSHERILRKYDRPVIDSNDSASEKRFREHIDAIRRDGDLDPFRGGYADAVEFHKILSTRFRETVFSNVVTDSVSDVIKKHRYAYEKSAENIEQELVQFLTKSSHETISKKCKQNFHMFFGNQEMTDGKLNFLYIIELFLRIREFNSHVKKEWTDLQMSLSTINMVNEGKQLYSLCYAVTNEAIMFCEKTDQFIAFLASLMTLSENDVDLLDRELPNKVIYFETFNYELHSNLVTTHTIAKNAVSDDFLDIGPLKAVKDEEPLIVSAPPSDGLESRIDAKESVQKKTDDHHANIPFTLRGTSVWNTREPYIIRIDAGKLVKDYSDLENSIYFNTDIPDPVTMSGFVKRAMILYMKNPAKHILKEYGEFVIRFISFKIDGLYDFFGFAGEIAQLFTYHLAPLTMYKIVSSHFQETGQGLCFKLLPGNKVARHVPVEFIKEKVLNWYENNINSLTLPYDRVSDYNEIKRTIQEKLVSEKIRCADKAAAAAERLRQQSGKSIDPNIIIQKKAAELFGAAQIIVYNRFIERTGLK
jgi:hypothetical protein